MTTPSIKTPRLPWDAADPYPFYERRRRDGAVVWDDTAQAWLVLGYRAAQEVLCGSGWTSDPLANPRARAALDSLGAEVMNRNMLTTDGAQHARLRGSVRDTFTRSAIKGLATGVDAIAADVIQHLPTGTPFDFMADFALPFPLTVAAEWLGLDPATALLLREESPAISGMLGAFADAETIESGAAALATLLTEFLALTADRRAHPRDDLLSLMGSDPELPLDDVVITAILIAVAGHETTANLLGAAMIRLLTSAPDGTRLVDRVDAVDESLVTELLRLDGPVQATARTATHDHVIADVEIGTGQMVLIVIAAANRDPAAFDEPDRFRLGRKTAPLSFGHGAHHCLGAALARLEITTALSTLLHRSPALAGPVTWRDNPAIRGPLTIPMTFGP